MTIDVEDLSIGRPAFDPPPNWTTFELDPSGHEMIWTESGEAAGKVLVATLGTIERRVLANAETVHAVAR